MNRYPLRRQPGVQSLSDRIRIDGIVETAFVNIVSQVADASAGTIRSKDASAVTLSETGGGTAPDYDVAMHTAHAILYKASGIYHEAPNTTYGDIATEDIVSEVVLKTPAVAAANDCAGKRNRASPFAGWAIQVTAAPTIEFRLDSGTPFVAVSGSLSNAQLHHLIFFGARSGSGVWYVDAVAGTPAVLSSVGSVTSTVALTYGEAVSGTTYTGHMLSLKIWKRAGWLSTHLQAAVAQQRYDAFTGGARAVFE